LPITGNDTRINSYCSLQRQRNKVTTGKPS